MGLGDLSIHDDHSDGPSVRVAGALDYETAADLERHLAPLLERGDDLCLDLVDLEFCDSAGLQVLVNAFRATTGNGRQFEVRRASPAVLRLLELTGLRTLFGPAPRPGESPF